MSTLVPARSSERVLVVIVNYRSSDFTIACLHSLVTEIEAHPATRVQVVENGSEDGSAQRIDKAIQDEGWTGWAELLALPVNRGYGAGNNAALRIALEAEDRHRPDLIWLLNPDTIVRPGALTAILSFFAAHRDVGIAGSRLEYADGTQHDSRYRFPSLWSELDLGLNLGLVSTLLRNRRIAPPLVLEDHVIDWVAGASMIVRRTVFERVGLFDECFFLYYEETDFCRRARSAGWPCWYAPQGRVVHLVGRSTRVTNADEPPRRMPTYWFESRRRYFRKHHGLVYAYLTDALFAAAFAVWRVRRRLQRKTDRDPPHFLGDFLRYSFLRSPARALHSASASRASQSPGSRGRVG